VPVTAGTEGDVVLHEALRVAHALRQQGHIVHFCHGNGSMKKQMKAADRLGSAFAVIVGGHEVQNRYVRIKNLYKREEEDVPLDKLKDYRFE
jgi:histidyl-tRNA synthetase